MAFFIKQNLCLKAAKLYNENGFTIVVIAIIYFVKKYPNAVTRTPNTIVAEK